MGPNINGLAGLALGSRGGFRPSDPTRHTPTARRLRAYCPIGVRHPLASHAPRAVSAATTSAHLRLAQLATHDAALCQFCHSPPRSKINLELATRRNATQRQAKIATIETARAANHVVIMDTDEFEIDPREAQNALEPFDIETAGVEIGATPLQVAFVKARLQGMNRTRAAKAAGYSGEGSSLRSAASKIERSPAVRTLLKMADERGAGIPDLPSDRRSRRKLLAKMMHGADKDLSIKAIAALEKMDAEENAEEAGDPADTLRQIADMAPMLAIVLGVNNTVANWRPSNEQLFAVRDDLAKWSAIVAEMIAARRTAASLNGQAQLAQSNQLGEMQ